jgi:ADP-ribose pyrophosphatase
MESVMPQEAASAALMRLWKTRARRVILNHNRFLTLENHEVELPDGRIIPDWPWIVAPDYVICVAVTENGRFLCFRQFKYGVGDVTLAPPGGYLEAGEDPLVAAQRELREETGYAAEAWQSLGSYVVDGNRGGGVAHLFLARRARPVVAPHADDLEEQTLLRLSRVEVSAALARGAFKVLPWATAVALALRVLDGPEAA